MSPDFMNTHSKKLLELPWLPGVYAVVGQLSENKSHLRAKTVLRNGELISITNALPSWHSGNGHVFLGVAE